MIQARGKGEGKRERKKLQIYQTSKKYTVDQFLFAGEIISRELH